MGTCPVLAATRAVESFGRRAAAYDGVAPPAELPAEQHGKWFLLYHLRHRAATSAGNGAFRQQAIDAGVNVTNPMEVYLYKSEFWGPTDTITVHAGALLQCRCGSTAHVHSRLLARLLCLPRNAASVCLLRCLHNCPTTYLTARCYCTHVTHTWSPTSLPSPCSAPGRQGKPPPGEQERLPGHQDGVHQEQLWPQGRHHVYRRRCGAVLWDPQPARCRGVGARLPLAVGCASLPHLHGTTRVDTGGPVGQADQAGQQVHV